MRQGKNDEPTTDQGRRKACRYKPDQREGKAAQYCAQNHIRMTASKSSARPITQRSNPRIDEQFPKAGQGKCDTDEDRIDAVNHIENRIGHGAHGVLHSQVGNASNSQSETLPERQPGVGMLWNHWGDGCVGRCGIGFEDFHI